MSRLQRTDGLTDEQNELLKLVRRFVEGGVDAHGGIPAQQALERERIAFVGPVVAYVHAAWPTMRGYVTKVRGTSAIAPLGRVGLGRGTPEWF